ncbi:MAG: site-2 protease family protein [Deltaproteobacteria bacterium]|nr:site-2 protease family protein [Deltaproteobacteria bacterium]
MIQDPLSLAFSIPYSLDLTRIRFDDLVSFIVGVLMAVTVHAEAQAFAATFLGDAQTDNPRRFHFNPLLHLDFSGVICFLAAGFGWPRPILMRTERFPRPRLYTLLAYLAGPLANFFMASIAGSVIWLFKHYGVEDRVFGMVMAVNLTMATYHLLPIPPLAGSAILPALFPALLKAWPSRILSGIGAAVLILYFGFERVSGCHYIGGILSHLAGRLHLMFIS